LLEGKIVGPELDAVWHKSLARQVEVDGAWSLQISRLRNQLIRPWVKGYRKHPILQADFVYLDVEPRS
jgi:hypothetical protein